MVHGDRLRYAMAQGPLMGLMHGQVEADETWKVGGRKRGRRVDSPWYRLKQDACSRVGGTRHKRVRAIPVPRVTSENLKAVIAEHVRRDATLMTRRISGNIKPVR